MTATADHPWQALEIVLKPNSDKPSYATPIERTLAAVVHEALWTYDCGPITYLSLPGVTRQRTLLWAGSAPTPDNATTLPSLSTVETTDVTPATQTLASCLHQRCTDRVGISVVTVDPSPLGASSAATQRVLIPTETTSPRFDTAAPAVETALAAVGDRPHALAVVASRGPDETTNIAVRLVDFTPTSQIDTRERLAQSRADPPIAVSEHLGGSKTLTNWDLLEKHGWELTTDDRLPGNENETPVLRKSLLPSYEAWRADRAADLADATHEYAQVFAQAPSDPRADAYERLGVTGQLPVAAEQLPALFPVVRRQYPRSVWDDVAGRTAVRIRPVTPVAVPDTMAVADQDPTANATRTTPASVDGAASPFERAVLRWCFEHGIDVIETDCSLSPVPFELEMPSGTHTLAYLVAEELNRGQLLGSVWQASHDPTLAGVRVFTETRAAAKQAAMTLLQPFKDARPSETETPLYRQPALLHGTAGVVVRPIDSPPEQWVVTPTNDLQCQVDGAIVAQGDFLGPLEAIADELPQLESTTGTATLTHPTDGEHHVYESHDAAQAATTPIHRPARPASLATGLESATVFSQAGSNFEQYRPTDSWNSRLTGTPEAAAARIFRDTYTVPDSGTTLSRATLRPELVSYLSQRMDRRLPRSIVTGSINDRLVLRTNRRWRYRPPTHLKK
ncbi:hypothetical protein [Halorubrum ezzemoulense]|uniref:hypothetical protein n=1 Tax=Halorubrum ezzemoulense TaxID=337243 RepID=UPI0023306263|nr:hypothetical protein [Halorubrum ezzemoulense]MDB9252654.1 hypothetical protein [Halorubrum ezzemoulense]MDB9257177.1 hypothetical protein [Halorubrum ezzemoulense]MDB9277271.1 hypothetical protein [Halorubrum ezzemoulense]